MNKGNETQVSIVNNLNIFDKYSNPVNNNHKNCSYCNKPFTEELWCEECDPFRKIEGWTSGNNDIDKFIKDTIYDARERGYKFLEWVPFDRFEDIKQIGVGGFAKVYSATWIDGLGSKPMMKVALKRLIGSQEMSAEYLNEVYLYLILFIFFCFKLKLLI